MQTTDLHLCQRLSQILTSQAILWQNIALALGIKAVFLLLALFNGATMWMAVFADMGASLLVVFNRLRVLRAGVSERLDADNLLIRARHV